MLRREHMSLFSTAPHSHHTMSVLHKRKVSSVRKDEGTSSSCCPNDTHTMKRHQDTLPGPCFSEHLSTDRAFHPSGAPAPQGHDPSVNLFIHSCPKQSHVISDPGCRDPTGATPSMRSQVRAHSLMPTGGSPTVLSTPSSQPPTPTPRRARDALEILNLRLGF